MTEAKVIKKDVVTVKNKTPKQVKGMQPKMSVICLSEYRDLEGFLEQIATHMGLSNHVSLDAQPGPGSEPKRPGPTLGPHHNGALPNRRMDHGKRRDDDDVSLLVSNEGIPDPPKVKQGLSQVCLNPVPDVTPKWSLHEVIVSDVRKHFW